MTTYFAYLHMGMFVYCFSLHCCNKNAREWVTYTGNTYFLIDPLQTAYITWALNSELDYAMDELERK